MLEVARSSTWAAPASYNRSRVVRHYVVSGSPHGVPGATSFFDKLFTQQLIVGECVMLPHMRSHARNVKVFAEI